MVILEAKAAGVPVAASRIGGIPDLIQHGQTGLLFDPNDSSQIEEAIRRILSDRLFAAQLSENARIEASKRFDPRVIAKQHVEIYQEVLN
jgi:glycosyltransferase involved in cell wall biosynthesis